MDAKIPKIPKIPKILILWHRIGGRCLPVDRRASVHHRRAELRDSAPDFSAHTTPSSMTGEPELSILMGGADDSCDLFGPPFLDKLREGRNAKPPPVGKFWP
jgi:hypothetical protein